MTTDNDNLLRRIKTTDDEGLSHLTIFGDFPGDASFVSLSSEHAHFDKIVEGISKPVSQGGLSADEVYNLWDMSVAVAENFDRITERVSVANGTVYFDGDPVNGSISDHIVRCLEADLGDWRPLVNFLENVAANPQQHSREQLYDWLSQRDFTITDDGHIIAYKGVMIDSDGEYVSIHSGPGIVNGKSVNGHVPNPLGGIIEIPRSKVHFDPAVGCSSGLHVGTFEYAESFAQGALLKVKVNPRDVVSVPTDCSWAKVRVCRYEVLEQIDAPETNPVVFSDRYTDDWGNDYEDYDYCPDCGEYVDECSCDYCPDCGEHYDECCCDEDDGDYGSGGGGYTPPAPKPTKPTETAFGVSEGEGDVKGKIASDATLNVRVNPRDVVSIPAEPTEADTGSDRADAAADVGDLREPGEYRPYRPHDHNEDTQQEPKKSPGEQLVDDAVNALNKLFDKGN